MMFRRKNKNLFESFLFGSLKGLITRVRGICTAGLNNVTRSCCLCGKSISFCTFVHSYIHTSLSYSKATYISLEKKHVKKTLNKNRTNNPVPVTVAEEPVEALEIHSRVHIDNEHTNT